MHHRHLKVALPPVRQGQGEVHEGIKLDGMELAVLHGADQGRLVQALRHQSRFVMHCPSGIKWAQVLSDSNTSHMLHDAGVIQNTRSLHAMCKHNVGLPKPMIQDSA